MSRAARRLGISYQKLIYLLEKRHRDLMPARTPIITEDGPKATKRFLEFFTANIRNPNTRLSYMRAVGPFLIWCEERGASLHQIEPMIVAA